MLRPWVQRVPKAELSELSRTVCSCDTGQMLLSTRGVPQSFRRVLSDGRTEGRLFVYCREFTSEVFLQCYLQAHQDVFGMLEVTSLRPALQEPWKEDLLKLGRCDIAGRSLFPICALSFGICVLCGRMFGSMCATLGHDISSLHLIR